MAIADNYSPAKYQGNGTTVNFSFSFAILNQSFAMVIIETISTGAQVVKTLGSDYTVSFDDAGGVVTMNVAPTSGEYIIIGRDVSINQTTPYTTSRGFDGGEVEESFDKLTAIAQDLRDFDKRCISFPEGSAIEGVTFPATPSTGKALKWASNGNLVNSDNDPDEMVTLTTAQAVAAAASASAASGSATTASNWAAKSEGFADDARDSADAAAASLSAAGLPNPATASTYLKRNAENTAYDTLTAAQVLADIGAMDSLHTAQAIVALGRMNYVSSSASENAVKNTYYRIASSNARTVTLPDSATLSGGEVIGVSRVSTGTVTIQRSGSDVIENALTSLALATQGDACLLYCDKAQNRWKVVYMPFSTTPADPYGVGSLASWPGVYTGSNPDETNFPVGHIVAAVLQATPRPVRNESKTLYTSQFSTDPNGFYDTYYYSGEYTLAGTWRHRGHLNTSAYFNAIFQRTA